MCDVVTDMCNRNRHPVRIKSGEDNDLKGTWSNEVPTLWEFCYRHLSKEGLRVDVLVKGGGGPVRVRVPMGATASLGSTRGKTGWVRSKLSSSLSFMHYRIRGKSWNCLELQLTSRVTQERFRRGT